MSSSSMPISTRWLMDSVGETGRAAINAVYMLFGLKRVRKGQHSFQREAFLYQMPMSLKDVLQTR